MENVCVTMFFSIFKEVNVRITTIYATAQNKIRAHFEQKWFQTAKSQLLKMQKP
jgi:hypothetical protein